MRLDHLSFAAGPDGLAATAERIGSLLGAAFVDGGVHPRFGTRNMLLPLADHTYLEVVETHAEIVNADGARDQSGVTVS